MFAARKKRYLIACIKNGETAPKGQLAAYKNLILPALVETLQENDPESTLRILVLCRKTKYNITEKQIFAEIRKYFLPDVLPAGATKRPKHNFIIQFFINIYEWIFGAPVDHDQIRLELISNTSKNATLQKQYNLLYAEFINYYKAHSKASLDIYINAILDIKEPTSKVNKQDYSGAEDSTEHSHHSEDSEQENEEDNEEEDEEDSAEYNNAGNKQNNDFQKQLATKIRMDLSSVTAPPSAVTQPFEMEPNNQDTKKFAKTGSRRSILNPGLAAKKKRNC